MLLQFFACHAQIVRVYAGAPERIGVGADFFKCVAKQVRPLRVDDAFARFQIQLPGSCVRCRDDVIQPRAVCSQCFLGCPKGGDIGPNRDVFLNLPRFIEKWCNHGVYPIRRAVFSSVTDQITPGVAAGDGFPHRAPVFIRLDIRLDHAVVCAQQLSVAVATDLAEHVIGIDDGACCIGDRHDGVHFNGSHQCFRFPQGFFASRTGAGALGIDVA
jgi:hypothetical protein